MLWRDYGKADKHHGRGGKVNRPLVTFYTRAYNAERYIEKTINSVLNQSEGNIEWILINNASTDNTGDICKKYAEKDRRIIYLENEKNTVFHPEYKCKWARPSGEYYSIIDADDYLDLDFVKIMYSVAKQSDADIAICGTNYVYPDDSIAKSSRIPPKLFTSNMKEVGEKFEELYGMLRVLWAKLFKTDFYRKNIPFVWDKPQWMNSGSDTFAMLRYLSLCKTFVSIDEPLHYFRIHDDSYYNRNISVDRVKTYETLYVEGQKLLKALDAETQENINFLQDVHLASMTDCLRNAANNVTAKLTDRLRLVTSIINDDLFCSYALSGKNRQVTASVIKDIVKIIIKDISSTELSRSGDFFVARIYKYENDLPLLLSGICSKDNKFLWGLELVEEHKDSMPSSLRNVLFNQNNDSKALLRNPRLLREESAKGLNLLKEKELLISYINNNRLEQSISILQHILNKNILDREGLYFKMYISWEIGEKETAVETAEVAKVFYQDDEDMMIMCGDIFYYIGAKDKAVECYEYAINNSNDENIKDELSKRIKTIAKF